MLPCRPVPLDVTMPLRLTVGFGAYAPPLLVQDQGAPLNVGVELNAFVYNTLAGWIDEEDQPQGRLEKVPGPQGVGGRGGRPAQSAGRHAGTLRLRLRLRLRLLCARARCNAQQVAATSIKWI